ncbi:hypothetical protein DPMN_070695 [Dreissena polymorpha]|uniref:Uncharacterized protein n=1 Tax=Dreissena polymorpha TaxID=45954 RepID=A0A9D3Z6M9_DREPO|nr:hypothetical protein DPMN_070695 [Dreissena polymorpha]
MSQWSPACIIGKIPLTKFHEDQKINVASRVITRFYYCHIWKNAPPPGNHVFQSTGIIFELVQDIIRMNLQTKFHEDRTVNVASRVLTRFYYSHIGKIALPLGSNVFQANIIVFKLIQDIIEPNLLTKFHEDWTIAIDRTVNVASRLFTRKNAPPPWWPYIIWMNLLTKFHGDRTINVASSVHKKNALPLGSHVFQSNVTILELIQNINKTNVLTKFYEDWTINEASRVLTKKMPRPRGGHVFQPTSIIFELVQDIIGLNLLNKFHEDWTINVASGVLTRFYNSHIMKNAPPLGSHVLQANITIFELIQDIIVTNLLTKFHADWIINVPSRELTRQMLTPHNGQKAITKAHHEHIVLR